MKSFLEKKSKLIMIVFLLLTLAVVLPVVAGSGYTYLCEDDFSFEAGANDMARIWNSGLKGGVVRAYEYYMSNQGTFLFNLSIHLLRIYTRWNLPGLHLFMILVNTAFAYSIFYLMKSLFLDKMLAMIMTFLTAFAIYESVGTSDIRELFYWYTGVLNFTVGLTLSFLSLGMLVRYIHREGGGGSKYLVPSMIFAFLGSGVALEITAPNCAFLLAVIILANSKVKEDKKVVFPFVMALIGAIINVVAPGNFVRGDSALSEGHESVLDAIRDTFECYINESEKILGSPVFWVVLAMALFVCVVMEVRIITSKMTLGLLAFTFVGSFLVQFFTMFPVCFGYHAASLIEMRTTSAYELIARIMYIFAVVCLAQFLTDNKVGYVKLGAGIVFVLLVIVCLFSGRLKTDLKSGFSYMSAKDLMNGSMVETYKTRAYVLNALDLAEEGSDVYLVVPLRAHTESAYGMGLLEDPAEFVNRSAAGLYHLNSVVVVYTD